MKKKIILLFVIFIILLIIGIGIFIYIKNDSLVAVLGYHDVILKENRTTEGEMVTNVDKFEKEIKLLKKLGYKSMTLDEFYCWKEGNCKKKHKSVLITFDDGYINNYKYAFDILKKYDMNGIVFYIGTNYSGDGSIYMNEDIINKTMEEYPNITFASHSYNLHNKEEKNYEIVNEDAKKMNNIISSEYYAYPFGDNNEEYVNALKDNGYKMAFGFGPVHKKASIDEDNFNISRLNISSEMPTWKFVLRLILPM